MPKELRKNEADFSWRRRRIFTGHGKYVRTPDSNYPKRRAEIITAQNKGCMIRAPCVSKPQHIFFYNWIPPRGRHLGSAGTYDRGSLKTDRRFLCPFTGKPHLRQKGVLWNFSTAQSAYYRLWLSLLEQDLAFGALSISWRATEMIIRAQNHRALSSSWLIKGNKKKGKTNPDGISGRLQE